MVTGRMDDEDPERSVLAVRPLPGSVIRRKGFCALPEAQ